MNAPGTTLRAMVISPARRGMMVMGALAAGLILAPFGWVNPTGSDLLLLGMLGVVAMLAHICVNRAVKLADAATVAPFQYTLLPWAILLGWLVFGDLPSAAMLAGAAIIIASGLMIFARQNRVRKAGLSAGPAGLRRQS